MSKKKEKSSVSLPKAWKTAKKANDSKQARAEMGAIGSVIAGLILAGLVAFILFGGISQRGLIEFCFKWSETVGHKVANILDKNVVVNEDGIYIDPNKDGGFVIDESSIIENESSVVDSSVNESSIESIAEESAAE